MSAAGECSEYTNPCEQVGSVEAQTRAILTTHGVQIDDDAVCALVQALDDVADDVMHTARYGIRNGYPGHNRKMYKTAWRWALLRGRDQWRGLRL